MVNFFEVVETLSLLSSSSIAAVEKGEARRLNTLFSGDDVEKGWLCGILSFNRDEFETFAKFLFKKLPRKVLDDEELLISRSLLATTLMLEEMREAAILPQWLDEVHTQATWEMARDTAACWNIILLDCFTRTKLIPMPRIDFDLAINSYSM